MQNFFEFFDFPVSYYLNESELTERYLEKQRFLQLEKNSDYRDCDNNIARLNEAYKTLLHPVDRAVYIIKLRGLQIDEISSESAVEMFEIHEKYNLLSSEDAKKEYQIFLNHRMSEIIGLLCKIDEYSDKFYHYTCLLKFIRSFLEKIGTNVYCRN
jgi:hypothetical protein